MIKTMHMSKIVWILFTIGMAISSADNPIIQTIYTADPAPMVFNGRVYLYVGHDEDGSTWFTLKDCRCFSSSDMVNWTDHGSPLGYTDVSWAKGDAWAAQVIEKNKKFYFYGSMTQKTTGRAGICVAVSDNPTGPFRDTLGHPLIAYSGGDIDPTVFTDSDGQTYLYWGNPDLYYVKLNPDLISYSGSVVKVPLTVASYGQRSKTDRPTSYEEGPWFYKRNTLYYMVFTGGPISEHIAYSTSPGPTGPWDYKGVIMPAQGKSFTNHSGICDFGGNSYFFYHNGALPGGGGYSRSVCVEKLTYNTDGTISPMNMTTAGVSQIGTLNPYDTVQAETICWESGVETEKCTEGGMQVTSINNGDYIKVKGVNFGSGNGATSFIARVAALSGGNIELRMDSQTGKLIGTCAVTSTGGMSTWVNKTCEIKDATGIHDLFLVFTGGKEDLFNFNWWNFTGGGSTSLLNKQIKTASSSVISVVKKDAGIEIHFPECDIHDNVHICLFGVNGKLLKNLFTGRLDGSRFTFPFTEYNPGSGIYIIKVIQNETLLYTNTFVNDK